jgi:multidrug efflux pump subunit AcrB
MSLSDLSIKNPVFMGTQVSSPHGLAVRWWRVLLAGLAVAAVSCGPLGCGADKKAGPLLRITARYDGASAEEVGPTVIVPIETELASMEYVEAVESISRDGGATITVHLRPGTDVALAQVLAQNRVSLALPKLPDLVKRHGVRVMKGSPLPALWLVLDSPDQSRDTLYLSSFAQTILVPELAVLPGVYSASAGPGGGPSVRLALDPDKLAACNLTVADVTGALREGAGPGKELSPEQLGNLALRTENGNDVHLRDVARVEVASPPAELAQWHGAAAVAVAVEGADAGRLLKTVEGRLPELRKRLVEGTELYLLPGPSAPGAEALLVEGRLPAAAGGERVRAAAEKLAADLARLPDPKAKTLVPAVVTLPADEPAAFRLYVALCPRGERGWTYEEISGRASRVLADREDMVGRVTSPAVLERLPRLRAPVVVLVKGPGVEGSVRLADEVVARLGKSDAVTNVWGDYARLTPRPFLDVDREKAKRLGVALADVMDTLQTYEGELPVLDVGGRSVRLLLGTGERVRSEDLKQLRVRSANGEMVPLGALASFREASGPAFLRRIDGEPALVITADPAPGTKAEAARRRCREVAEQARKDLGLEDAYKVECPGSK